MAKSSSSKRKQPDTVSTVSSKASVTSRLSSTVSKGAKKIKKAVKKVLPKRRKTQAITSDDEDIGDENESVAATSDPDDGAASSRPATSPTTSVIEVDEDGDEMPSLVDRNTADDTTSLDDLNAESELDQRLRGWKSLSYAFFERRPEIEYTTESKTDAKYYVFRCIKCRHHIRRATSGPDSGSTGALGRHITSCWGSDVYKQAMATKSLEKARDIVNKHKGRDGNIANMFRRAKAAVVSYSSRPLSRAEIRVGFVRWIAECARPFNIAKDRFLLYLLKTGRAEFTVPHPTTISNDVKAMHSAAQQRLAQELQDYEGFLAYAIDCWTAPNHHPWMCITVTFLRNGEPLTAILDFVELAMSHTGENMAKAFNAALQTYGIEKKTGTITCDNASNNDKFFDVLEILLPHFSGRRSQVRCFAHTVNLTAKSTLRQFEVRKRPDGTVADDEDTDIVALAEGLEVDEAETRAREIDEAGMVDDDDVDGLPEPLFQMEGFNREEWQESIKPVRQALIKARKISFKIINSPTLLLPRWCARFESRNEAVKILPRDVATRWNSTFDMLAAFLKHKADVRAFTADLQNSLRDYELDDVEWDVITQLVRVLTVLKDATLFFSSDTPTIASVIPAMDAIDHMFATAMVGPDRLSAPIRAALGLGKATLNRYYSLTDKSDVYRIAIILHPSLKLDYFRRLQWPQNWIDTARDVCTERWLIRYKGSSTLNNTAGPSVASSTTPMATNTFTSLMATHTAFTSTANSDDELDRYLADSRVTTTDPLGWWLANAKTYPTLAQMAIDYHIIPSTSVSVERSFSRGRILITHLRNRLRSNTVCSLMCLGDWCRSDIVDEADLIAVAQTNTTTAGAARLTALDKEDDGLVDDELYL